MKTMRKLFTVLLALAMTLALAVPAFAADTGSITITNPQGDHTYTAYKIFDVTYSGDNYSYTISGTDAAFLGAFQHGFDFLNAPGWRCFLHGLFCGLPYLRRQALPFVFQDCSLPFHSR